MQALQFLLSLKNNLSAPLGRAQQSVERFARSSADSFKQVGIGAAGLWGVTQSVKSLLAPAHQVQVALDELSTRNVDTQTLDKLYNAAQTFSTSYGKSAAEFIASSTVIKSQIAGITDTELPRYTVAINTLAVATKGTAQQAASYMSDLTNQFAADAARMGNIPFAETLASKTAYMVQNFGADMAKIQGLMAGSKGMGSQYGAGMDEQLIVLGELSRTLGTGAGGAYEKFLKGAVEGGKSLGLSFTNAQGKMLAFPDILQKLEAKFGSTVAGNLKAQATLNKAFGEGAQALTAAWGQADALRKHMRDMGNTAGLDRATEMAGKMADMWERVDRVWERIRVAVGMRLIPAISPLVDYAIAAGTRFARWLDLFPNIARWIGYIALATLSFAAAGALANIVMGVSRFIWMGLIPLWKLGAGSLSLMTGRMGIMTAIGGKLTAALGWLRSSLIGAKVAAWAAAAGFTAITWPIVALVAAIAAVVVAVIKFWQPIKAFISGFISGFSEAASVLAPIMPLFDAIGTAVGWVWQGVKTLFGWFADLLTPIQYTESELASVTSAGASFGRIVAGAIGLILTPIVWVIDACRWLDQAFADTWKAITLGWELTVAFFTGLSPVEAFNGFVDQISGVFSGLWASIMQSFGEVYNWIAKKLNKLPGVNIDLKPIDNLPQATDQAPAAMALPTPPGINAPRISQGGINKTITNGGSRVTDNSRTIGEVNIYPQNAQAFDALMESRELAAP
ncbi:phage tail tape measure protein [Serratia fonticola]|uniref:phage tail tape measure protein n=1 Tax=Serratia fonticola TaxID=47917 RepID=UPI0015C5C6C0|nr:phage tail tape measure protein [Serratia fonticola]NXZ86294.1 phage tail tape measure protein [Serratia fonticola]